MDLEKLYFSVDKAVSALDFSRIWPGFSPLKFALYDNEKCFFDGRYVEKTDAFCANTSIVYEGEQIAIWMAAEELDVSVLTSKIVHEMFHGFQNIQGWDCWPDEMEALHKYNYSAENLALKLRENELLLRLLDGFYSDAFKELLAHRKLRSIRFPYEFSYESKVEEIEGTANYVEWQVLRQLDETRATALTDQMRNMLTTPERLLPIRIPSYYIGALTINSLIQAGLYSFCPDSRPVILEVLENVDPSDGDFPERDLYYRRVSDAIRGFNSDTEKIIRAALDRNEVVLQGPAELVYVNVYNARCYMGYITSTFFVMYSDGNENRMLQGNFVIRMTDENNIGAVYRWI